MARSSWRVVFLVAVALSLSWALPRAASARSYAAGAGPYSVAAGDLNGDGKLDVAVAHFMTNNVTVLLGNGDGTFQRAYVVATFAADMFLIPIAVGDVNGDGKLDLITASVSNVMGAVMLGNGDGTFQPPL